MGEVKQKKVESRFRYVTEEVMISRKLGYHIGHPVRVFTLAGLGIDQENFLQTMAATFAMLNVDRNDIKRREVQLLAKCLPHVGEGMLVDFLKNYYAGRASLEDVYHLITEFTPQQVETLKQIEFSARRKRSVSSYLVSREVGSSRWVVLREPESEFVQDVEAKDLRSLPRVFEQTSYLVSQNSYFRVLVRALADTVGEIRPGVTKLAMTLHQVSLGADRLSEGDGSPEGIHQDGADFIVSALVINRVGVLGGESVVYGPDKKTEYLRHALQPGEGLFQADRNTPLWHDVTPVLEDPNVEPEYGSRETFGFDINLVEEK